MPLALPSSAAEPSRSTAVRVCLALALMSGAAHAHAAPGTALEPTLAVASASRTGAIGGDVTSELTSRAVEGATVVLEEADLRGTTDASGRFRLAPVPEGTYRLVVMRDGFLPSLVTGVVVAPSRETPLLVRLQEAVKIAEQVSVNASAFEKPIGVTNGSYGISYEEVRRAPGALADVGRMVQALPGLGARDDQRSDIVARGGSPAENLTLVDGVEVPNLNHFGAQGTSGGPITTLDSELVSDVGFLAGGFPSEYGNRLSSVLEINLREGSRDKLEAEFDLGMAGAGMLVEGPIGKKGSWLVSGRRSYIDLIAEAYGLTSIPQYANYQAKAVYDVAPASRLSLISLGGWDTIASEYDVDDLEDPNTFTGSSTSWRDVTGLSFRQLLGGSAVATLGASHALTRYEGDFFDQQLGGALVERNRSTEQETTLRGDVTIRTPGGSLKLGGSAKRFAASLVVEMPFGVENPFSAQDDARMNVADLHDDVASWQPGGYLQLSQRIGRVATVNLGTRYDRFALTDEPAWSPRAGLVFHLHRKLDLTTSVGRYHQSPALLLLRAHPQNAGLLPMRADHAVVGVELRPARDVKLSLEAYHKSYDRYPVSSELPFLTMADAGEQYEVSTLMMPLVSRGKGRSSGVEAFAQKKIGGRFWGQISYAWSRTEQSAFDGVWRHGTFDLPHVLSVVAGTKLTRRLEVSSKFTYSSGRPTTPILYPDSAEQNRLILDTSRYNEERAPAYHRLDFRLDHRSPHRWGNLTTYVELDNVYDRENVRFYYWNPKTNERYVAPQLSFMVLGGLNVEF